MTFVVRPVSVGFDGSAESLAAAAWAGREAVLRGTSLHIVHALEWRASNLQFSPGASAQREWAESRLDVAREELAVTRPELVVEVDQVSDPPVKALVDAARESEFLVLGSRGLGVLQGFLLGSVSLPVIARASRPVVVVHGPEEPSGPSGAGPVVVGLGHDGPYGPLLDFAFAAAAVRGADLHIVRAGDTGAAAEALPDRSGWPSVEVHEWLPAGPAAQHLVEAAGEACLLVVGRRGHRPGPAVRIGPVAHAVLHHARCPVAVVPHG
ncbi:universal stress protein [Streptomyces sp. ET3-23]|uniref:universal stress protein n=1 Tax=Streptomyces sp. ET3-23 TaxID=2885643 RepID=UPI001D12C3E6|nr:universal stress protein [Streptomyces sp. ET3-23]MCC2274394.1 universal stress protein [Streptomyces sp. ET3-23]